jgi:glucokinase
MKCLSQAHVLNTWSAAWGGIFVGSGIFSRWASLEEVGPWRQAFEVYT